MKNIRRIISLFMCLVMLCSLFGCKVKEQVIETIEEINRTEPDPGIDGVKFTLPYLRTDSLDPYKAENTLNRSLSSLLYDSLFALDDTFKAECLMAESYTYNDNTVSVKLKSVTFTDGTEVTAEDVVYSFVLAKKSTVYSVYLKNITDASASDSLTVVFTLKYKNPYEVSNLIFPIIKANSDKDNKSSDEYSATVPIGSGRYYINDDGKGKTLCANKKRLGGYYPKHNEIGLRDVTEASAVQTLFSLGEIDFYSEDFSDGTYKRYTGAVETINTTKFTYIGVNNYRKALSDSRVRRAVALLLDREDIVNVAYSGYGTATVTPFCTGFYDLESCTVPSLRQNKNSAIELLEEAGFNAVSSLGIRYGNNTSLELSLVVNKDNDFRIAMARNIRQALSKANIKVNIKELTYSGYVSAVENGSFDLYIGETVLPNSFDTGAFFRENGALSYGIDSECASAVAYKSFENGEISLQEFLDAFCGELPFIPVAFRQGITVHSDRIKTETKTVLGDCFGNIDEWMAE